MFSINPHLPVDPAATGAVLFFFLVAAPLCTGAFLLLRHFFEGKQS